MLFFLPSLHSYLNRKDILSSDHFFSPWGGVGIQGVFLLPSPSWAGVRRPWKVTAQPRSAAGGREEGNIILCNVTVILSTFHVQSASSALNN